MQSTPSTHFDRLPGQLPPDLIHEGLRIDDLPKLTQRSLESLESSALSEGCLWRDWLSITGKVRTYCGAHQVAETWRTNCTPLTFSQIETFPARVVRPAPATSWADVQFNFTAKDSSGLVGISSGTASFIPDQHRVGDWKIWMLATMLDHFVSHGHPDSPPPGPPRSLSPSEVDGFSVIIVGAGQSGLSIAGRLQTLGISYVLLEQKSRVGHGWYGKYDSVTLHTTKEFNNLPFERLWSADDPNRLPARKVVEGFERFIHRYKINVWFSCHIEGARWDADARVWSIRVDAGDRGTRSLRSRHLALTMGAGHAIPNRPCWPGVEEFQGTLLHSSEYKNSRAWEGRRGIVVGTGTSAHDVAQDMFDAGLSSVTMVQRQKTAVWPFEWLSRGQARKSTVLLKVVQDTDLLELYNREIPTSRADAIGAIFPEKISRDIMKRVLQAHAEEEKDWFDALEHSGFRLDREIGLNDCIQGRYGGY